MSVLPGLRPVDATRGACKVCGGTCGLFGSADFNKFCNPTGELLLGRSNVCVEYDRCAACGFIFTRFCDDWTAQDFARFIYNRDYILVDPEYAGIRPERLAGGMSWLLGPSDLQILDYGSGAGHFGTCLMSKGRHRVTSYDPFSSPGRPSGTFDLVTCHEVLEHSPDPDGTLRDILQFLAPGGLVIATTACQPPDIERLGTSWWYIAPRNGHVSIYTEDTLARLAGKSGVCHLAAEGYHVFHGPRLLPSSKAILERLQPRSAGPTVAAAAPRIRPTGGLRGLVRSLVGGLDAAT
jgi:2-polyprenyl-6-hydroxyphenyl methylase/3-demethylubiquinone-9 3-methyltransferase